MSPKGDVGKDFPVAKLQAGRTTWVAGVSGPQVTLVDSVFDVKAPKHQNDVTVAGKVLNGEYLAFEWHSVNYSRANIRKLLKREKEFQDGHTFPISVSDRDCSPSTCADDSSNCDEVERRKKERDSIGMMEAMRAFDLAPRRSIQVKLKDIVCIDTSGDTMTLTLSHAAHCYAKRAGKPRGADNMEVVQDFTGGAKTITFKSSRCSEVRHFLSQLSSRLEALFAPSTPPQAIGNAATPNRKRALGSAADGVAKQPRRVSGFFSARNAELRRIKTPL